MSESTLSLGYPDLLQEVCIFLGYGADSTKWTTPQSDHADRYVQAGIRQFYYPPTLDGVPTHDWTFLQPTGTIDTCLLYTSPSPRDGLLSRMPSSA